MTTIHPLIWDSWNVDHIARHQVSPDEVEQVCNEGFVVRAAKKERLLVIGATRAGKILAIVLSKEQSGYYVVTARPADRKERRIFREERGGVGK